MSNFNNPNQNLSFNAGTTLDEQLGLSGGFTHQPMPQMQYQQPPQQMHQPIIEQNGYNFGLPAASSDAVGRTTIEVRKLYLGLTRPQGNQHRRSYDVVLDGQGLGAIQEEVSRIGVNAFDPLNISNLMSKGADFIRHSGTASGAVGIDNGWETERFRFTMLVDVFRNGRFSKTEFVSGYTDYMGVSGMGMVSSVAVDRNMIFTINHITEAQVRSMDYAGRPIPLVSRSNGVVRNNAFTGMNVNSNQLFMTRPSDILRAVDKVQLYNGMAQAQSFGENTQVSYMDMDSTLTGSPRCSASANSLIPTFTSRTLRSLFDNSVGSFDPMNMDNTSSGMMASQRVEDNVFSASSFVHVMNRALGNGVATTAQFSYSDLLKMDPTIDDRADIFGRSTDGGPLSIPDGRDVYSLGSAETISVHATSIVQTTLALMSLSGVATIAYNANNHSGNTEMIIQACDGMDNDGQLAHRLSLLRNRMILECFNIVTMGGEIPFEVDVFADAFNDVYIQIIWDGVRRDYVVPAFASSSLAPVVTDDISRLVGIAEAIDTVVDTCRNIIHPGAHDPHDIYVQGSGMHGGMGLPGDY